MNDTEDQRTHDVLRAAFAECRTCDDDEVDTEHLLLAVLSDTGPAAVLLAREISQAAVRRHLDRRGGLGRAPALTPQAERALRDAEQVSHELRHDQVTAAHIIIALLRPGPDHADRRPWWRMPTAASAAVQILKDLGVDVDRVYRVELDIAGGEGDTVEDQVGMVGGAADSGGVSDTVRAALRAARLDHQPTPSTPNAVPGALYRYLRHDPSCEPHHRCSCGLAAALSRTEPSAGATGREPNRN